MFFAHRTGVPVTRFQVMGERSSGTNFAKRVLGRNTPLKPTEALGWKHGFAQMAAVPADTVIVCMVRNAVDWVRSMHAKPWHCSAEMQRLDLSGFIRAEWDSLVDRDRYFEEAASLGLTGQPLQHDRHPLTGARFADIFALRQAKLAGLSSYLARDCNVVFARMETLIGDPEIFVAAFSAAFALPAPGGNFRGITRRLGSKFKPALDHRPATPAQLSPADLQHLKSRLDPAQEAALGYSY
ncbi:hypothetical protein [Pseudooceanicola sp.]|uniref:hypothetical protein n=1 Tax=Pseudooceanicola sp. TaxID=1914328 RepID=UPI00261C1BB4|nr:hypothetical protein [Pseudooceanicola sp.]MDF1854017.1 hypothetical protein [Pseudooceanicola sp.]